MSHCMKESHIMLVIGYTTSCLWLFVRGLLHVFCTALCVHLLPAAFNPHLVDPASPVNNTEPCIYLIYTNCDKNVHFILSLKTGAMTKTLQLPLSTFCVLFPVLFLHLFNPTIQPYRKKGKKKNAEWGQTRVLVNRLREIDRSAWEAT